MTWSLCESGIYCHGKWTGKVTAIPSTHYSTLGTDSRGTGTNVFPDGVTMMVDWRNDLSMEYYNYSAVTIDYTTGAIESNDDSLVQLSNDANLDGKGPGTYVHYNSTTYRTDLFHVYSQPGVYPAAVLVAWSVDGQSVEESLGCICRGENYHETCRSDGTCSSSGFKMCESGDAVENSFCRLNPLFIGRNGMCRSPPPVSILYSPFAWVVWLVSVALAVILIRRCQTRRKESLLDQPFHGESGLNHTGQIS